MSRNDPQGVGIGAKGNNNPPGANSANPNPNIGSSNAPPAPANRADPPPLVIGSLNSAQVPAQNQPPEEEKKIDKIAMTAMADRNPQLVRSYLLPNNDRYILE